MVQPFPKMIYKGGIQTSEWRIVADEEALDAAKEEGFLPTDEEASAPATPLEADAPKSKGGRPRKSVKG